MHTRVFLTGEGSLSSPAGPPGEGIYPPGAGKVHTQHNSSKRRDAGRPRGSLGGWIPPRGSQEPALVGRILVVRRRRRHLREDPDDVPHELHRPWPKRGRRVARGGGAHRGGADERRLVDRGVGREQRRIAGEDRDARHRRGRWAIVEAFVDVHRPGRRSRRRGRRCRPVEDVDVQVQTGIRPRGARARAARERDADAQDERRARHMGTQVLRRRLPV